MRRPRKSKTVETPTGPGTEAIEVALAPLHDLDAKVTAPNLPQVRGALTAAAKILTELKGDDMDRELVKEGAKRLLKSWGYKSVTIIVNAAFKAARKHAPIEVGQPLLKPDPAPWDRPVDGATLLTKICAAYQRHCSLPSHADVALALNAVRTHVLDSCTFNPIVALMSPLPRCGKTRVLEVSDCLVCRSLLLSHIKPAGIARTIDAFHPTLLLDEGDTYEKVDEKYRNLLNSVHSRASAWVEVQVPTPDGGWVPRRLSTYAPLYIGLIGGLPPTVLDRSIGIYMQRKLGSDSITPLGEQEQTALVPLKRQAIRWGIDHLAVLKAATPTVPTNLDDRAADCWRPLLAVAEAAGGEWPALAQGAAVALSGPAQRDGDNEAASIYLLRSLRKIFGNEEKLSTLDVVRLLNTDEEAPWRTWNREYGACLGIQAHDLSRMLRPFRIKPKVLWFGAVQARGYERAPCAAAWNRYLSNHELDRDDVTGYAGTVPTYVRALERDAEM